MSLHDFRAKCDHGTLTVDHLAGGALLVQVCVVRQGREEWNSVTIPRRHVKRLLAVLEDKP